MDTRMAAARDGDEFGRVLGNNVPRRDHITTNGAEVGPFLLSMERRLYYRILWASLWSASIVPGVALILPYGPPGVNLVFGAVMLGPAHLLRAAALLQRSAGVRAPSARGLAVALLSVIATAVATGLLSAMSNGEDRLEEEDTAKWLEYRLEEEKRRIRRQDDGGAVFCILISFASLFYLADRRIMEWTIVPREAAHRRFKAGFLSAFIRAFRWAILCLSTAAWFDCTSVFTAASRARFFAGLLVLLAADLHSESIQNCGMCISPSDLPSTDELSKALAQPLATCGPGLGRWTAMAALAQAVAHRQQGAFPGVRAGTGMGISADASRAAYALPLLTVEMFSRGALASAWAGDVFSANRPADVKPNGATNRRGVDSVLAPTPRLGYARGGLFAVYLNSGLEVLREFTIRVQCLTAAARCRGSDKLHPAQIAALEGQVVELMPLARVTVAGLAGWISVSRDLDEAGVVQRESALQRILYELCGLLCATETLRPLHGALLLSVRGIHALQCGQEEAMHSIQQLLFAFEDAGLNQVVLPPLYKRVIAKLCQ